MRSLRSASRGCPGGPRSGSLKGALSRGTCRSPRAPGNDRSVPRSVGHPGVALPPGPDDLKRGRNVVGSRSNPDSERTGTSPRAGHLRDRVKTIDPTESQERPRLSCPGGRRCGPGARRPRRPLLSVQEFQIEPRPRTSTFVSPRPFLACPAESKRIRSGGEEDNVSRLERATTCDGYGESGAMVGCRHPLVVKGSAMQPPLPGQLPLADLIAEQRRSVRQGGRVWRPQVLHELRTKLQCLDPAPGPVRPP